LGIVDAFKGLFSFIPGLGGAKAAPPRQPARLSSSPLHSRNALRGISQPVNASGQEAISLPVGPEEFKVVYEYIERLIKNPFQLGMLPIPPEVCVIAPKMARVSKELAKKMGIPLEELIKLSNKFKTKGITPVAISGTRDKDILTKLITFYEQSFNVSKKAMAPA
jgi:hypothetical protein